MRSPLGTLVLLGCLAACDAVPTETSESARPADGLFASARTTAFTVSQSIPLVATTFVPCANGGAGELVDLTGRLHDLFHVTRHSDDRLTVKILDQPQGVSGVGESTGDRYRGTGVSQTTITNGRFGSTFTHIDNFRIIGPGPGNNFTVHVNTHITVNANGTVTVEVDHVKVECQ
jgi:hypothetical protein